MPGPRPFAVLRTLLLVATLLAAPPFALAQGGSGHASPDALGPIDIDTADAAALAESLPGIGPVKARRIVAYRERHGPFGTVEALLAVKGIGPVTVERIRVRLEGRAEERVDGTGEDRDPSVSGAARAETDPAGPPRSTREL